MIAPHLAKEMTGESTRQNRLPIPNLYGSADLHHNRHIQKRDQSRYVRFVLLNKPVYHLLIHYKLDYPNLDHKNYYAIQSELRNHI